MVTGLLACRMTIDDELPAWARAGRAGLTWTGQARPPFATVPGTDQESVWDYPRPPRLVPDPREVTVACGDTVVARTTGALRLLETAHPPTFYLPRADVDLRWLERGSGTSRCEWKGLATYYDVVMRGRRLAGVAWSYERPLVDARSITGYLAFYANALTCCVAGERAVPQPGGFYGGWITPELVGPFKGEPDSDGW